jgi:hypothetical protein
MQRDLFIVKLWKDYRQDFFLKLQPFCVEDLFYLVNNRKDATPLPLESIQSYLGELYREHKPELIEIIFCKGQYCDKTEEV